MLPSFRKGMTLERIDNERGYSPENCRWATHKEQSWNRGNNVMVDTPWGRINIADAAERSGINYYTLWQRHEDMRPLFAPLANNKPMLIDTPWGKMTFKEAAERSGIKYHTLYQRWAAGKLWF